MTSTATAPTIDASSTETPTGGLTLSVYTHPSFRNCTNGDSARVDEVLLVGVLMPPAPHETTRLRRWVDPLPPRSRPVEALRIQATYAVEVRTFGAENVATLVPVMWWREDGIAGWHRAHSWTMFGGNYAATTDSRFSEAMRHALGHGHYGALAIHDRVEGLIERDYEAIIRVRQGVAAGVGRAHYTVGNARLYARIHGLSDPMGDVR